MKQFYVYILCDRPYGYLYTGVTSNLVQRIHQHKSKVMAGHTQQKNIGHLDRKENQEMEASMEVQSNRTQ